MGFHPVLRYGLPRSSETWSHLENLAIIPGAMEALDVNRMLDLFGNRQHYTKYPLFYAVTKALSIDSPLTAAIFSAMIFSIMPLLVFLLAGTIMDGLEAFTAGILSSITIAFVYTMNFFSGGEPIAFTVLLLGLYIYFKHRPIFALPLFLVMLLLHPFTSIFLWIILLVIPIIVKGETGRKYEVVICTGVYSLALVGWFGFQIARNLPLGGLVSYNVSPSIAILIFSGATIMGLVLALGRERFGFNEILLRLTDQVEVHLPKILLILEIFLLSVFLAAGFIGTEKTLTPSILLFYSPLLVLIALVGLRHEPVDPIPASMSISFLALLAIGLLVFPGAFPTYRLAPYGALCLVLIVAPLIRDRRMRFVIPLVAIGLGATVYPGPDFYFGFDEQYYPSEMASLDHLDYLSQEGRAITDVRMEDLVRYESGRETVILEGDSLEVLVGDLVLVTSNMRETGLYPLGAEWYKIPFKLDLDPLDTGSERLYDNGQVELAKVVLGTVILEVEPT